MLLAFRSWQMLNDVGFMRSAAFVGRRLEVCLSDVIGSESSTKWGELIPQLNGSMSLWTNVMGSSSAARIREEHSTGSSSAGSALRQAAASAFLASMTLLASVEPGEASRIRAGYANWTCKPIRG